MPGFRHGVIECHGFDLHTINFLICLGERAVY